MIAGAHLGKGEVPKKKNAKETKGRNPLGTRECPVSGKHVRQARTKK